IVSFDRDDPPLLHRPCVSVLRQVDDVADISTRWSEQRSHIALRLIGEPYAYPVTAPCGRRGCPVCGQRLEVLLNLSRPRLLFGDRSFDLVLMFLEISER